LAPRIEDAQRGAYLKWMVYSSAVLDPVVTLHAKAVNLPGREVGFGAYDEVVGVLVDALKGRKYLLGDKFSAADVVLGSVVSMALYRNALPQEPALVDYNARLTHRPAYQRAADATWPPSVLAALGTLA
jgi:glutathione S-transferase